MGSRSKHSAGKKIQKGNPANKGLPSGSGGRRRDRDIMDIVDGAQSGKKKKGS